MKFLIIFFLLCSISFAQVPKQYALKIPPQITKDEDKIAYAYKVQEELRKLHNQKGEDAETGKISMEEFKAWQEDEFFYKQAAISEEVMKSINNLMIAQTYNITINNVEALFEEKIP